MALYISVKTSEFEEDTTVSGKLEQYGEDTDFHGVKRILRKDYGLCRRLIWLGFFLIGIGFVVFSITDRLLHYFSYPHKTTVDVLYEREVSKFIFDSVDCAKHVHSKYTVRWLDRRDFNI